LRSRQRRDRRFLICCTQKRLVRRSPTGMRRRARCSRAHSAHGAAFRQGSPETPFRK